MEICLVFVRKVEMNELKPLNLRAMRYFSGYLSRPAQEGIISDLRAVVAKAPLFSPVTPSGKKMSVQMTSAGRFGWISDRSGYRYSERHPNGGEWPEIPASILAIWQAVVPAARAPECCLLNFYKEGTKMGLHVDKDEADFSQPVVSISLGDEALFRVGNATRGGSTESIWLSSGDVVVMEGESRLLYHGIDRVKSGTSDLLSQGGRINVTLRVVT